MFSRITYGARGKATYFIGATRDSLKECMEAEYHEAVPRAIDPLLAKQAPASTIMTTSKAWPRKSDSMGVHPNQKEEAEAMYKKLGVPTEVCADDGRLVIRDSAHQRDLQKAMGYRNNHGGYGQVCG